MRGYIRYLICVFCVAACFTARGTASGEPAGRSAYLFPTRDGEVSAMLYSLELGSHREDVRQYAFPSGNVFQHRRAAADLRDPAEIKTVYDSFLISGSDGEYTYYDGVAKTYVTRPLAGELPRAVLYIRVDGADMALCPPMTYAERENASLEYFPELDGTVTAVREGSGFRITVSMRITGETFAEYWYLRSDKNLADWESRSWSSFKRVDFTGDSRWCFDGYYYKSPSSYIPTGENYFWRIPDAYLTVSMAKNNESPASWELSTAQLDVMLENRGPLGFFPSMPRSGWLYRDYGIDGGFHDTRFNADVFEAYLISSKNGETPHFYEAAKRYADFFLSYAEDNHFEIKAGGSVGWLVCDYCHPSGGKKTHTSLNHQLQEISFLYQMSEASGDLRYSALADRMRLGIALTRDKWIMKSGNLEYAYMPNGKMGLKDYPYLVYNDLFKLQNLVTRIKGSPDSALRSLMDSKKRWMDKNGITGYMKN